jgi:hypothetical protein
VRSEKLDLLGLKHFYDTTLEIFNQPSHRTVFRFSMAVCDSHSRRASGARIAGFYDTARSWSEGAKPRGGF